MEVSLVGKPETIATPKSCCICGKETDFMVAHKTDCYADAGCDCNLHVCSSTACEVRGVGRGIFHRTKINPRRNPMEMEVVEEAEVNEEPEEDMMSNPNHDHDHDEEEMVDVVSNPQGVSVTHLKDLDYEIHGSGKSQQAKSETFTIGANDYYAVVGVDGKVEIFDENDMYCCGDFGPSMDAIDDVVEWWEKNYDDSMVGEDIASMQGIYDSAYAYDDDDYDGDVQFRNNPAESKLKKYAKTGGLLGAGAILGWFLKDRLD